MAEVSVLLATYKPRPAWLDEAVDSVLGQTFGHFELVVLDDEHSPETRSQVLDRGDPRIRYVAGPQRGPGANHAAGIEAASADLLAIINHDDVWEPNLLERLLAERRGDAVLVFADHSVIDAAGRISAERSDALSRQWGRADLRPGLHRAFDRLGLVDGAVPLAQAAVFERAPVRGLPGYSGQVYDRYLTYLLARTGRGAVYVPERLARWRETTENLTSRRSVAGAVAGLRLGWDMARDRSMSREVRSASAAQLPRRVRGLVGAVVSGSGPARRPGPLWRPPGR